MDINSELNKSTRIDRLRIHKIDNNRLFAYDINHNLFVGELFYEEDSIIKHSEIADGEFLFVKHDVNLCFNSWSDVFINPHFIPKQINCIFLKY